MMMSFEEKTKDIKATFRKCLESPEPYVDDEQKEICRRLVEELPEELLPFAASTSYAYWYLALEPESCPSEETKIAMAMREARRHFEYMVHDFDKALTNLIESCEYRKEHKLDLLRTCFDVDFPVSQDDEKRSQEIAELVLSDMQKQYVVMRGRDRHNRTVMIKFPRTKPGTTEDSYVLSQIYMAERSVAATEFLSLGTEERSLAVYDYNGFDSSNAPPFKMQVTAATMLQKLYPERLQTLVMVEGPFWLRGVLNLLGPFLSASITERIKMASGLEEKESVFGEYIDAKNATPLLLKDGKLDTPVSLGHFLEDVPFYCLYDDANCERPIGLEEKAMQEVVEAVEASSSLTASIWSSVSSVGSSMF